MTWLDWLIGAVFGLFIFFGYKKGFVAQFFDLLGSVLALILAFYLYPITGQLLADWLHFSVPLGNIISFVLIVVIIGGAVSFIGQRWQAHNKTEPIILADRGLGALFGGLKAAVILIIIFLVILALPLQFLQEPIAASSLAGDLLRLAPIFYVIQDFSLPSSLPRLVVSPEGLQVRAVKTKLLDGATCIACGGKVKYLGPVRQGLACYPQVRCPQCDRKSDGCLTFEGYHMLHGVCPYERFGSMSMTDCKVWPNPEPTRVNGVCPVCGKSE